MKCKWWRRKVNDNIGIHIMEFVYDQSSMWVGFSRYCLIRVSHCAAKAPSTARWSQDTMRSITSATLYWSGPLPGKTFFSVFPTPKILAWGGLIIEVTVLMPNIPRLLMVEVPPTYSDGSSFPSLALFARSLAFLDISSSPKVSALLMMGVIRPPSIATAILTSAYLNCLIVSPCHCTLTRG